MKKNILFFIILFISTLLSLNNNESIFRIPSSARNSSLGGPHLSSNDIGSIFDAPLTFNFNAEKYDANKLYISYDNQYDNQINIFHIGYCLYNSKKMNLGIGLVNRTINDNYNTSYSWEDNGDGYPQENEINHNLIFNFKDQELGFIISYSKKLKNSILGVNFKPLYHSIDNNSSVGLGLDVVYLRDVKFGKLAFGILDISSYKKWNNGTIEKFDSFMYVNSAIRLNNLLLCFELNSDSQVIGGLEFYFNDTAAFRFGSNGDYISFGFGYLADLVNIDYAYIKNYNSIFPDTHKVSLLFSLELK